MSDRFSLRGRSRLLPAALAVFLVGCPDSDSKTPAAPDPAARTPTPTTPLGILDQIVVERCTPEDPWALAHGILVRGAKAKAGGKLAIDRLVSENLGGGLRFPSSKNGWPVEPHPGMFVKTLLEVGVPTDRAFAVPGGRSVTLGQLAQAYMKHYSGPAPGERPFHNQAWLLEVAAATQDERVEALREHALTHLEEQQAYLAPWVADPTKPYRKPAVKGKDGRPRPVHIHQYYCGGLHFVQGVARLFEGEAPPRLRKQFVVLLTRLTIETSYWDRTLAKVEAKYEAGTPQRQGHTRNILAQKLKLQGHVLEAWGRAIQRQAISPSTAEQAALTAGFAALDDTIQRLSTSGTYAALDQLKTGSPSEQQLYRDLVGDSAHALHAYRLR